jgi:hypothetical protein
MTRIPVYTAKTRAQITALASPVRLEILTFAAAIGPCSLPELARACGRPSDSLYRHARLLLKHKMLVAVKASTTDRKCTAGRGRRAELLIDAAAEHYRVDYDPLTGRGAPAFRRLSSTAFKAANDVLQDNEGNPGLVLSGPTRNFGVRSTTAWLTPEQLRVVVEALDTASAQFECGIGPAHIRPADAVLHHFTYVLAPVIRRRGESGREG